MNNQYWTTIGDRYDGNFNSKSMNIAVSGTENLNSVSCSIPAAPQNMYGSEWYSVLSASPVTGGEIEKLGIGEGMSIIFRLKRTMKFGDLNGYNGMVSFCWAKASETVGYDDNSLFGYLRCIRGDNQNAKSLIPYSLHHSLYNRYVNGEQLPGGFGGFFGRPENSKLYGISVTLYPDEGTRSSGLSDPSGSLHEGTTRVSCFKLTYKTAVDAAVSESICGYLPKSVDLSADTTLFINSSFGKYHVYINGMKICDISMPNSSNSTNNINSLIDSCRFGMCAMGAWNSPVDFEIRNLTYVDKVNDMVTY